MKTEDIQFLLKDKWYIQSGNLTPVYLMEAWFSGFAMKNELGVGYSAGLFTSKNETGDLYYRVGDLERLYDFAFDEWKKDKNYFANIREKYRQAQRQHSAFQAEVDRTDLKEVKEWDFYPLIQKALEGITESVGVGHLIEAIAITSDERLKKELEPFTKDAKELNEAFVALTAPENRSFAEEAEEELRNISKLEKGERKEAIGRYIIRWGWMRNSYAGRKKMQENEIMGEVNAISKMKRIEAPPSQAKEHWITKLSIPTTTIEHFKVLSFITDWQDERKKFILNAIDRLETILEEYSDRTNVPLSDLRYALHMDFTDKLPSRRTELAKRREGICVIAVPEEVVILTGKDYESAFATLTKHHSHEGDELRGLAASLGTVRGKVKVCTTLESLNEVVEGDILVASMTRPEYLPAMKKAAAFVTDEGGITCHAAIVAREMGKPCVIGTKVATKVLKDGDIVEVKGNHGVVIIRERIR